MNQVSVLGLVLGLRFWLIVCFSLFFLLRLFILDASIASLQLHADRVWIDGLLNPSCIRENQKRLYLQDPTAIIYFYKVTS